MNELRIITAPDLPPPNGHYAHAVAHAGLLYVSGQLGRGPRMSAQEAGDITAQTRRSLASIAAIAVAAGSDISKLLKVTIYLSDIEQWPAVDAEYRRALGAHRPARAVVPTGPLHFGALVEIDAVAAL